MFIGNPHARFPNASCSVNCLICFEIVPTSKSSFAFRLFSLNNVEFVPPYLAFNLCISQWNNMLVSLSPTAAFHLVVIFTELMRSSMNF
mmetsp:Transcript_38726/g.28613  ORF Transcript_38726/g.28613 Transcript_38726/m.28613 type:complete len:89 (-) Transcript_38726:1020-1286(-)